PAVPSLVPWPARSRPEWSDTPAAASPGLARHPGLPFSLHEQQLERAFTARDDRSVRRSRRSFRRVGHNTRPSDLEPRVAVGGPRARARCARAHHPRQLSRRSRPIKAELVDGEFLRVRRWSALGNRFRRRYLRKPLEQESRRDLTKSHPQLSGRLLVIDRRGFRDVDGTGVEAFF